MRAEIEAFARKHGLSADATVEFAEMVAPSPSVVETVGGTTWSSVDLEPDLTTAETEEVVRDPGDRYEDLGPIAAGGMGEVRRVRDRELNRTLARKTLHAKLLGSPRALARFVEEAQATSQLQHPNIVPIYDMGVHRDGRIWFTMREVRGRTLGDVIHDLHRVSAARWRPTPSGWSFRRLLGAFVQACRAVGYAHERGVVHRDLKPDNIMVGEHGEVYVLDWGLAKILGRALDNSVVTGRASTGAHTSRSGSVSGTPVYMAPEQARGETEKIEPTSDVYGLGALLYEILSGQVPVTGGQVAEILERVGEGDHDPLPDHPKIPADLRDACLRAMAFERKERFASASELASEVQAWLDGARRREQALGVVERALAHAPEARRLRSEADALGARAEEMLASVEPWASEEAKRPGWTLQREANAKRRGADLEALAMEHGLHGALRIDGELPEAHAALVEGALASHRTAELSRDADAVARAEATIHTHLTALAPEHPVARQCAAYLKGTGALTLVTDVDGAEVELLRFVERHRRRVPEPVSTLGRTPLVGLSLPMGSYLCRIRHPDRVPVDYPVSIGRSEHWDGVPPGGRGPFPIHLPTELAEDEVYVPAGWFVAGGDPACDDAIPRTRLWCDGLVVKRHPVTNAEFIQFLDDLVAQGREDEALALAPATDAGARGSGGSMIYGRTDDGGFALVADAQGDVWEPDVPVLMIRWDAAFAYTSWLARRTGKPWRLPGEFEWEKAARGVDARWYPWGDHHDPSWSCMRESHAGRRGPAPVTAFPVDVSVYGVWGMAGNVRDLCATPWQVEPELGERVPPAPAVPLEAGQLVVSRGGNWGGIARNARCVFRSGKIQGLRSSYLGFRPVRSLG